MDWSATLSLTTSHAPQHRANYGSFSSSASLKRISSSSTISIPQSIPENQCVVQFSSPRLPRAELQVMEHYDAVDAKRLMAGTSVMTITETTRLTTFKMLLTNPSASSVLKRLDGGAAPHITAIFTEPLTEEETVSSYWLQERERMRLQRERRYLQRNGSPTKASTLRDEDDPETSRYKTATIMCSVPLVLVLVFVVVMLVFGDGSDVASAVSPRLLNTAAVSSPISSAVASSAMDPTSTGRLRGPSAHATTAPAPASALTSASTATTAQDMDLRPSTTTTTT